MNRDVKVHTTPLLHSRPRGPLRVSSWPAAILLRV
jgi:hypothetical protein